MKKLFFTLSVVTLLGSFSVVSHAQSAMKFFSVNRPGTVLAEDINTKGTNLLGINTTNEDHAGMTVIYARGEKMPQYLIASTQSIIKNTGYTTARFLMTVKDAEEYKNRLAFVEGNLYNDGTLEIQGTKIDTKTVSESGEGTYSPVLFSFRLTDNGDEENFLIESWAETIGSHEGEWVKIENHVPVITRTTLEKALSGEAEVFNTGKVKTAVTKSAANQYSNLNMELPVRVLAGKGTVTVKGATGKNITITNSLGQRITSNTASSDNELINVPAGVIFVSVDGKPAIKTVVK